MVLPVLTLPNSLDTWQSYQTFPQFPIFAIYRKWMALSQPCNTNLDMMQWQLNRFIWNQCLTSLYVLAPSRHLWAVKIRVDVRRILTLCTSLSTEAERTTWPPIFCSRMISVNRGFGLCEVGDMSVLPFWDYGWSSAPDRRSSRLGRRDGTREVGGRGGQSDQSDFKISSSLYAW